MFHKHTPAPLPHQAPKAVEKVDQATCIGWALSLAVLGTQVFLFHWLQ